MRRGVKSRLPGRPPSRRGWRGPWLACLGLCLALPSAALAQPKREAPFLLGGSPEKPKKPKERDPWLPTGAEARSPIARPGDSEPPGCSPRHPVCVHRGKGISPDTAARALGALERARERLVRVLALPAPLSDAGAGGGDALDLYLTADDSPDVAVGSEPLVTRAFDRAAAFCVLGSAERALLEREATLCVAEAIALRLDPAETPDIRRAYATHLWLATGQPTSVDAERFDDLQAHPERAIVKRAGHRGSDAGALLFEYLDAKRGFGDAGDFATSLLSASVGKTAPNAWLWDNGPDIFDVLRRNLDDQPREVATLFLDLAVTRAFLGDREDGAHLPELAWLGAFGRPRFEWSIPFSTLPRRVAMTRAVEPTGSVFVWLSLDRVPDGAELGFQAEWEAPVSFHWSLVRIDAEGRELGRLDAPFTERGTKVEQNMVDLKGAAGVLIVGVNLGGTDLAHPFDPDLEPFEPHGCTVYLAKL